MGYRLRVIGFCLVALMFASCEDTTFRSSVPTYPVHVVIDMDMGSFVHFQNMVQGEHIDVLPDGFYYNDQWVLPLGVNACGYGGVLVYVSVNGYDAYDLACPYCASKGQCSTCIIDGMFAKCMECGEEYDVASGTAAPQKGLIRETLRRLSLIRSGNKLTITHQ